MILRTNFELWVFIPGVGHEGRVVGLGLSRCMSLAFELSESFSVTLAMKIMTLVLAWTRFWFLSLVKDKIWVINDDVLWTLVVWCK